MQQKKSISAPKKGMSRDTHQSQLDNVSYNLAVNINTTNEQGDSLNVQLEPSNYFGVIFPKNYKVIGFETDLLKDRTYYLLTNTSVNELDPNYKRSSIGYVDNSQVQNIDYNNNPTTELNLECGECGENAYNTLPIPLEEVEQTPSLNYVELLHDRCIPLEDLEEKGLNFNINFPAKKIEINQEKQGTTLYWNDYRNCPRYLNVTEVENKGALSYVFEVYEPCEEPTFQDCLNVDRLRVFPKHNKIQLDPTEEQIGGNLKKGTYEYWAAYCDLMGNEMTEYCTPTNPVSIFDRENNLLAQTDTDEFTNFAVKIKVRGLDTQNFKYYKVAVVERNNVNNTQSVFLVGIYPTTDDTILHTHSGSNNDDLYIARGNVSIQKRMDFNTLLAVKPNWEKAKGTMVSGDILFHHGLVQTEEINLQPVFNIFGSLLHWQSNIAKEDLYKSAIATSKYKGYMRNEVQPFSVRAFFKDGGYSSAFPLIARPPKLSDIQLLTNDKNLSSVTSGVDCQTTERNQVWQIYNTASEHNGYCEIIEDSEPIEEIEEKSCQIEDVFTIPEGSITIPFEEEFFGLKEYLEDNPPLLITTTQPTTTHNFQQGLWYLIYLEAGDSFASVGYTTNGQAFQCTSSEQKVWSNGSKVYLLKTEVKDIHEKLLQIYSEDNCTPNFGETCEDITLISEENIVAEINNEQLEFVEKLVTEYTKVQPVGTNFCNMYERDVEGFLEDIEFQENNMALWSNFGNNCRNIPVFVRTPDFFNQTCNSAEEVINITNPNQFNGSSVILNYGANYTLSDLQNNTYPSTQFLNIPIRQSIGTGYGTINSFLVNTGFFSTTLHKNAQFFKIEKNGRDKIILEIGKRGAEASSGDAYHRSDFVRYTIYSNCSGTGILDTPTVVDISQGHIKILNTQNFPNTFFVAIDSPVASIPRKINCELSNVVDNVFYIVPPRACFSIYTRDIEYKEVNVNWESIILNKIQNYQAKCIYTIHKVSDCEPRPYKKGEFAFWQSTDEYDDNKELWDSSNLKISPEDLDPLSSKDKQDFLNYYVLGGNTLPQLDSEGYYILGQLNTQGDIEDLNFRCKKIRHFKFPDNTITPYIIDTPGFRKHTDSLIFPLSVEIDSKVFESAIKIAHKNGLITRKELENIAGFEILRGDNSISKSVIANGIAFDMYNYTKRNSVIHFPNFPFNDLGDNKYVLAERDGKLISHPFSGNSNYLYSFISPDLFLTKTSIPTEVSLQGYLAGATRQEFTAVDKHSEWTILGKRAKKMALTLASVEFALEATLIVSDATKELSVGISSNIGGKIAAITRAIALGGGAFMKIGKYRYDWLVIFRDLGKTYNFASMQVGVGNYNRFIQPSQNSQHSEYLRRLKIRKHLKEGKYIFTDESNGSQIRINNWLREASTVLSTGIQHPFLYPEQYKNIDNNKLGGRSSNFIASEVGGVENQEFIREVASPYFSLKNYIPNQWGTIDTIKWLTTNEMIHLGQDSSCKGIFGGTVCISRFSWRRKVPIFTKNAIFHADKQPFMYSRYDNIGYPRFWANYELDEDSTMYTGGIGIFPDINSKYNFDSQTGDRDMYLRPPSKMYTSVHGIVDFLVESEINCNFRFARKDNHDWFYPQHTDLKTWLQESTLSLSEPNTFFYNNIYTFPVSNTSYKVLDRTYSKELWKKIVNKINAAVWSQKEINENDLTNPWLVYKPLDWYEFKTNNGELIDLHNIESNQFLARFENKLMLHNAIDNIAERITPQNREVGIAGVFLQRPMEHKSTDLGFAGTQNTEIVSTPYGHFWCDALRGKVFKVDQNGQQLEIISEVVGGQPSNMKQWFREHLPFKILKYFPKIDINNKFKGLGLNMWWDDRESRVFITKRDYIIKKKTCLEYDEERGFYNSCGEPVLSCPINYVYNEETGLCEKPIPCTEDLVARVYYTAQPPYVGHVCNRARFNLLVNGVNVGIVNLNNGGGLTGEQIDEGNVIVGGSVQSRESFITFTAQNIIDILQVSDTFTFTLECRDPSQLGGCHTDIAGIDVIQNGGVIYSGSLGVNTSVSFNPCSEDSQIDTQPPTTVIRQVPIYFDNEEYFEDVSWTISYKPMEGTWNSYFSFYPDYSPFHNNFFQVGYNWDKHKETLWNHLMNNSSFCVFQGEKHTPILEFPITNENVNKILNSISLNIEGKHYQGDWDFAIDKNKSFKNLFIYNKTNHTGMLELVPQEGLKDVRKYPITEGDTQKILFTSNEDKQNINYFFNRIVNQNNNIPMFNTDKNSIFKTINTNSVKFTGKRVLERLKGEFFIVHLEGIQDSRFNLILKNIINNETAYQ